jgi:hypothetical protein
VLVGDVVVGVVVVAVVDDRGKAISDGKTHSIAQAEPDGKVLLTVIECGAIAVL